MKLLLMLLLSTLVACVGGRSSSNAEATSENIGTSSSKQLDSNRDGVTDENDLCANIASGGIVDSQGCSVLTEIGTETGTETGADTGSVGSGNFVALYDANTMLEPMASFVRNDGVVVTRIGDRGRDRHAKDITPSDHYDHYLAHYWEYRTACIQFEDHVPNGKSLIKVTFITEEELGACEFWVWFWGQTTTAQFHFNPQKEEDRVNPNETGVVYEGSGTWDENFVKTSSSGHQYKYTLNIIDQWKNGGAQKLALQVGTNMEFESSQFLRSPPAGSRLNYYGTSYV
jgi:hypothetical protein